MIDAIGLAVGGGLLASGWIVGRFARWRSRPARPQAPRPICTCDHPLSSHDRVGTCHATVERAKKWDVDGDPVSFEHVPCSCQQYVGPKPLDELYLPPLLPPTEQ